MTQFRELTLDDKPSIDRVLAVLQPEISDLTFTNLFMWHHSYGLHVSYQPDLDYWLLLAKPPHWPQFFLPPVGDWSDPVKLGMALQTMLAIAKADGEGFWIRRAPAKLVRFIQNLDPTLTVKEDRNTFDYQYRSHDLINLEGRSLHSKRNHLNQFQRKYNWEYQIMTLEHITEILAMQHEWFNICSVPEDDLNGEDQAMTAVLRHYHALGVSGGVILVDGKIQALAIGERLNHNTAVIHIEKANTEFKGIYATINQQFAAKHWAEMEYINREEDMGIEGLRKAKLSYHPDRLIEKYSIKSV